MTRWLRVGVAVGMAGTLAASSRASPPPHFVYRYVAFVTLTGKGSITSVPRGIDCPRTCRFTYPRGTHVRFRAVAAPGWRFAGFSSRWCDGARWHCAFDLVSPHDCIGGACPIGAFGVRALFVRR